eukprot:126297-Pelagomonas_calceolata.AAC.3
MQDPYRPEAALRSRQRNSPSPEDNPSSRGPSQGALQHNRTARAQTALQHNSPSLEDSPSSKGPFPEKREGTAPAQVSKVRGVLSAGGNEGQGRETQEMKSRAGQGMKGRATPRDLADSAQLALT